MPIAWRLERNEVKILQLLQVLSSSSAEIKDT